MLSLGHYLLPVVLEVPVAVLEVPMEGANSLLLVLEAKLTLAAKIGALQDHLLTWRLEVQRGFGTQAPVGWLRHATRTGRQPACRLQQATAAALAVEEGLQVKLRPLQRSGPAAPLRRQVTPEALPSQHQQLRPLILMADLESHFVLQLM